MGAGSSSSTNEQRQEKLQAIQQANINDFYKKTAVQTALEIAILTSDVTCNYDLSKVVAEKTPEELVDMINQYHLKYKLDNQFYDPELMKAISCLLKVGLTVDANLTSSDYVSTFFTNARQIGADSVEGIALLTGVKGVKDTFVIKAPRKTINANQIGLNTPSGTVLVDGLIHEYFVAAGGTVQNNRGTITNVIGTNWLRRLCLNYAQVLGAFRCGSPTIDPLTKKVKYMCGEPPRSNYEMAMMPVSGNVSHIIYERIQGKSVADYSGVIDLRSFINVFIQLAYALEIGQVYNGFTHYDLHHENILLREIPGINGLQDGNVLSTGEEALIPFMLTDSNTVYISSRFIATIIDLGRCHIQYPPPAYEKAGYPTDHFGYFGLDNYGVIANKARPYYDIFKLLGFTLFGMYSKQNSTFEQAWPIMGFFGLKTKDDVIKWLVNGRATVYSPADNLEQQGYCLARNMESGYVCISENSANMFDFLEFIENNYADVWSTLVFTHPMSHMKTLKCGAECRDFSGSVNELVSIHPANSLKSLTDYRDVIRFRNNYLARGNYFAENYPQSTYGVKVIKDVENLDKEIIEAFPRVNIEFAQKIVDMAPGVINAFNAIGYPFQYPAVAYTDYNQISTFLLYTRDYLDRMQKFGQIYGEFREYYEAGEDMARIALPDFKPNEELTKYVETNITPLYNALNISRGEIRSILMSTITGIVTNADGRQQHDGNGLFKQMLLGHALILNPTDIA